MHVCVCINSYLGFRRSILRSNAYGHNVIEMSVRYLTVILDYPAFVCVCEMEQRGRRLWQSPNSRLIAAPDAARLSSSAIDGGNQTRERKRESLVMLLYSVKPTRPSWLDYSIWLMTAEAGALGGCVNVNCTSTFILSRSSLALRLSLSSAYCKDHAAAGAWDWDTAFLLILRGVAKQFLT